MSDTLLDVYLGFMDEEVNTVLNGLLDREVKKTDPATRRPVVLVERGEVSPDGPILEWPLSRYAAGVRHIAYAHADALRGEGKTAEDARVESILARAMSVFLERNDAWDAELRKKNIDLLRRIDVHALATMTSGAKLKVPLDGRGPCLSVVRFDIGEEKDGQPPIVVVRSPEMGLQPNLMSPYIEFILMMVGALSSQLARIADPAATTDWPVRISCFGAQGGATAANDPGSLSPLCASLYVGYDYSNSTRSPSVAVCSQGGIYRFGLPGLAEGASLNDYFIAECENLKVSAVEVDRAYTRKEEAGIAVGQTLKSVIATLVTNYGAGSAVTPEVSGTSPWFISLAQKQAFARVGVTGCNMEDYWVMTSMRECKLKGATRDPRSPSLYPVLAQGFLTRVNADPLKIEPEVDLAFQGDVKRKQLTGEGYVSLLLWGLLGLPLEGEGDRGMPAVARWSFAGDTVFTGGSAGARTFSRHLYGMRLDGGQDVVVPDPFFVEIATDLLNECSTVATRPGNVFLPTPSVPVPGPDALAALQSAANGARGAWKTANQTPTDEVRKALATFVDVLATRCGFALAEKRMKVWLRPNKWEGVAQTAIQDIPPGVAFAHAAVDRAFYKASNVIALRDRSARVLRD
jgi:hypothetical protein